MAEPIHDKIKRSLQAAGGLYHRLVLLAGGTGSGKTDVLRDVAEEFSASDIKEQFIQQLGGWNKNKVQLNLRELLNHNFLCYDGKGLVPEQMHAYLSTNGKELLKLHDHTVTRMGGE